MDTSLKPVQRTEKDSLGEVLVSEERLWGAQTERALHHFSTMNGKMPEEIIRALVLIKKASATANKELGVLSKEKSKLIIEAIDSLTDSEYRTEFPLSVWQTGSGTQTNMNVNEVISNKSADLQKLPRGKKTPLHPNDDVNLSQSSNDIFPSAMNIAFCTMLDTLLYPAIDKMMNAISKKEEECKDIITIGRTHLMDAVPMLLSDMFSGFRAQLLASKETLQNCEKHLHELALGGTAVGTGLNCPPGFKEKTIEYIKKITKIPYKAARNTFEALSCQDSAVELSSALKRLAIALMKIANDIRLLGSGPRSGIGELILPENEPGSSIMPGKVNPTQCESMTQIICQVIGNDAAITVGATHGHFQLHVFKPLIAKNCIESIHLLTHSITDFIQFCLTDLQPNRETIQKHVTNSLMLATALTPTLGYDTASKIALYAHKNNISLKEASKKFSTLSDEEFDRLTDPKNMV